MFRGKVIRKSSVVAQFHRAVTNLKPRKIENKWSPALKSKLQTIIVASQAQQASSEKRIKELKTTLASIESRKAGRDMTVEEVMLVLVV